MTESVVVERLEGAPLPSFRLKDYAKVAGLELDFDPDALLEKYRAERDKRYNSLGLDQYRLVRSGLNDFVSDPWANPDYRRDPINHVYDVLIIGGGFTGLQVAARLITLGYHNICIVEKVDDIGGTWHWNRYPGAQCDIESYMYMSLLEEIDYVPKKQYARGPELCKNAHAIADHYNIQPKVLFQTETQKLIWNDETCLWKVETNWNDSIHTKWVVPALGPLQVPKFPGVDAQKFKGKAFHSCRWDYKYTGGSPENPQLTGLKDKRVAVIGTGASGVQVIAEVGKWAKELVYVVQRTPSSIDERRNQETDVEWAKSLPKVWQTIRMENFSSIINGEGVKKDMIKDGWTEILTSLAGFFGTSDGNAPNAEQIAARMQIVNFMKMESIRKRVDSTVKDPKTAAALKPWYSQSCKPPCFHDEYLPNFNNPNVKLIDTDGKGVEAITERGFAANSEEIEVDCIIYTTGFEWNTDFSKRTRTEIIGVNGGISTLHGWAVNGLPNMTLLTIAQAGGTPNFTHNIYMAAEHLTYVMNTVKERGIVGLEPTHEAAKAWVQEAVDCGASRRKFLAECTPGFYNDEDKLDDKTFRNQSYDGGGIKYNAVLKRWREDGKIEGMVARYASEQKKLNGK
ncbi:hypothetical protein COCVIDRAFT_33693 [Bipolaris victoriae FI3]|uniref:FAD/NAD(P)-binding domain-containing protein n=1 Tax=Bipolaris victoriae (strain FI3) TaxID=930091 RepID=W7EXP4_BIPV3|nr:hypothetical protein COCVIDRAFT_33693 [Bipolaris victoriae FI3]